MLTREEEKYIRKKIGKRYHLSVSYPDGRWFLYRQYDDFDTYFNPYNTSLLNSEDNTKEELLNFVKKYCYDEKKYILLRLLISLNITIFMFIDIICSGKISGYITGSVMIMMLWNVAELLRKKEMEIETKEIMFLRTIESFQRDNKERLRKNKNEDDSWEQRKDKK